jgi:ubiquinone/menaquinone biosynthesis C-methylase UbiE
MPKSSFALEMIIRLSQYTPFGNSKRSFTTLKDTFVEEGPFKSNESDHEAKHLDDFFGHFEGNLLDELRGMRILDLGCGYGGKAVALSKRLPTSTIIGVEPHQHKINKAIDFAMRSGVENCSFKLCTQESIPLGDDSVDALISHDVIEHVHDPATTVKELHRVLRKGGKAYLVFPPYEGALSHHLDFITLFPGLHWFWSADTIMETVNKLLPTEYGERFKSAPQPLPTYSAYAGKRILPSLNGLGTRSFERLVKPLFSIKSIERTTVLEKLTRLGVSKSFARKIGRSTLKIIPIVSERVTLSLVVVLEKP